jgi:hypothetical protein
MATVVRCKAPMRRALSLLLLGLATAVLASPPPPPRAEDRWASAINAAQQDLAACRKIGAKLYGDVTVNFDRHEHAWSHSASKSLGALGGKIAACVQDALARRFTPSSYDEGWQDQLTHEETIGVPVVLLPPPATLLPVWRRARTDAKARRELEKLLPPDYQVTPDGCFRTARHAIANVENLWLPTAGAWVPRLWEKPLGVVLGHPTFLAMWRAPDELITQSTRGMCLVAFDAAKQAALRAAMDKVGSCWEGSFEEVLLHPHFAFPAGVAFTQVATQSGRVCALSTTGEITCCGRPDAPPPKGVFTQVTVGGSFGCALDAKGEPTCWGAIAPPPKGPFTKLSAEYSHACGVRPTGEVACWGAGNYDIAKPPAGSFTDVASASFSSCGVHKDGRVECWGESSRQKHPAGKFVAVAATWTHACGVRKDGTLGCWAQDYAGVDSPIAGTFRDIAVGDAFELCARRTDGTIACTGSRRDVTPPPAGTFAQLAGDHDTFCAVGTDRHVACWGSVWPGAWQGDNTFPYAKVLGLTGPQPPAFDAPIKLSGRVVDEHGAPIANADVLACAGYGPCIGLSRDLATSTATLAQLAAAGPLDPTATALRTTSADGTWTATVQRAKDARWGDPVVLVITAPGREIAQRESTDPAQLAGDVMLRPAASVDFDLRCGRARCASPLRIAVTKYQWYGGTHLERLPPGAYTIEATSGFGQPGERRGSATVTVTFAGGAQHVVVAMKPLGTGTSIKGTVVSRYTSKRDGITVRARCDGSGRTPIYREAKTDAKGAFEIRDVGAPPCTVEASAAHAIGEAKVSKVPADGVRVLLEQIDDEFRR